MMFDECLKKKLLLETGEKDFNRAKELLKLADHKLSFWKEVENMAGKYPSLFIEGYYEIIKELAVAILMIDGWKSDNHDCLFQYLLEKKDLEIDFAYLSELRKLRNDIDYRGIRVSHDVWKENKLKLQIIAKTLSDYLVERLP